MTEPLTRPFLSLQVSDLQRYPVWESVIDTEPDVTVFPLTQLPVDSLSGRIVGTHVRLGCGQQTWSMILYTDTQDARKNEHFVQLDIERDGRWFFLSRYWDVDYERNGPQALAQFLGMELDDVFPIDWDVSQYAKGHPAALSGFILREPRERLPIDEIIRMAVPRGTGAG
jgi:hypothetical protein